MTITKITDNEWLRDAMRIFDLVGPETMTDGIIALARDNGDTDIADRLTAARKARP